MAENDELTMTTINEFYPEAVIIDAGSFPKNQQALRWLESCHKIVCCDGAANRYLKSGHNVWRIVGDCDSLSEQIKEKYAGLIRKFPDQETNDQTKAVRYLASKGIRDIVILGATGMREDHTLGNLSLLPEYLRYGINARAYTDYGVFIPVEGDKEFICMKGSKVSIFNFGTTGMTSYGLKYPVRDFTSLWEGTLNETLYDTFTIRAKGIYMVFINYPDTLTK